MLKKVIFWSVVIAVGVIMFCLIQIRVDLSQKVDNIEHTENTEFIG